MENVVCIASGVVGDGFYLNGHPDFDSLLEKIEGARFKAIRDKSDKSPSALENNTNVRQLVVYIFVQDGDDVYIYRRAKGSGEKRLVGNFALPGGHMESLTSSFVMDIIYDSTRELHEELVITKKEDKEFFLGPDPASCPMKIVGILQNSITDDINTVNLVHTGIVVKFDITDTFDIAVREDGAMCDITKVSSISDFPIEEAEDWLKILSPWIPQITKM